MAPRIAQGGLVGYSHPICVQIHTYGVLRPWEGPTGRSRGVLMGGAGAEWAFAPIFYKRRFCTVLQVSGSFSFWISQQTRVLSIFETRYMCLE